MAADLDAALQPDERIVYRTCGRSYASGGLYYGILFVSLVLFVRLNAELRGHEFSVLVNVVTLGGALGGAAVVLLVSGQVARWWQRWTADEFAVTDRRVLFANGDWDNKLETMELSEITRVCWIAKWGIRHLSIRSSEGTIELHHLRDADGAARATADATGLEAPPVLGRLARVEPTHFGIVPAIFAIYLCLILGLGTSGLSAPGGPLHFDEPWSKLAFMLALWIVAALLGPPIGGALTLAVLRPFVPAERTQAAICAGRRDRWGVRLALGWAGLLYGRRMTYQPG